MKIPRTINVSVDAKTLMIGILAPLLSYSVVAGTDDASMVFAAGIAKAESYYKIEGKCEPLLSNSWHKFSGQYNYDIVEKRYMDGALQATLCGLRRGWWTSLMLGELEALVLSGYLKKHGVKAAIVEAEKRFLSMPIVEIEKFTGSVQCNANTPRISYSGYFENTISVSCVTNLGPVKVDLASLRIQVAGRDAWNGPDRDFFGRSLRKVLGANR